MHAGFHGTHLPSVLTSGEAEDNTPDPHDEADFEVPDMQKSWMHSC